MTATDRVMVFDQDAGRAAKIAEGLDAANLKSERCDEPHRAVEALRRERPAVAVVVGAGEPFAGLAEASRDLGIPTLALIEPGDDPREMAARARGFDDWACLGGPPVEVAARVAALLDSRASGPRIDPKFLGMIVHDLRTPLNVIGLTIRAIHMSMSHPSADLEEDLTFLTENARQIEKMLAQLGDYCRLIEEGPRASDHEFDPRRFLSDFLEDRKDRPGSGPAPIRLELDESSPREVRLDMARVRTALHHAVANAASAAGESPVRIRSSGRPGRWILELIVDQPPPNSVTSTELRPDGFERLIGVAAERRGLDLAIAAGVTRSFGGTARLEVEPGWRSTVILDWPDRHGPA